MAIERRTVFMVNRKDGTQWFTGWAMVETGLGTMVEPFVPNAVASLYEPTGEMERIDEFFLVEPGKEKRVLSGDADMPLHGGQFAPSA